MNNTYLDLVSQTFNFPQEGLEVKDGYLQFNGLDIKALIDKYGTPMKLTYLPKIGSQIGRKTSSPEGAPSALLDPTLYDGSKLGSWRARFPELQEGGVAADSAAEKPKG